MAGRQPEPPRGPFFVCQFCGEPWNSSRELAVHIKAHFLKGKAPAAAAQVPAFVPSVPPPPPAAFRPAGPRTVPFMPRVFLPPPPPPPATMGLVLGQRVAPAAAGLFFGGLQPRRPPMLVRRQPRVPQLQDPVVFAGAGGPIRMVLLEPNHDFWAPYRMGMDDAPVELDFMGLRPRPASPSPSFASWLDA